jgi:hypothetical protein
MASHSAHSHTPAPRTEVPHQVHGAQISTGAVIRWGALIAVAFLAVVIVVCVYFTKYSTALIAKNVENTANAGPVTTYQAEMNGQLGVDKETLSVTPGSPISGAMEKVVEKYGKVKR